MADIERVVKGTPEQLTEILTNGSITVDDITVTREEIEAGTTLFDTGRLDQMELNQQVKADMHRLYSYNHTSFAVKDIKAVYNEIISADNAKETPYGLADVSAIGFVALLQNGDKVYKQDNRMFIYGANGSEAEEETAEYYQFSGENSVNGTEFVIVWYFANNGTLNFATSELSILILAVVNKDANTSNFNFGTNYYEHIDTLIGYDFYFPASSYAKRIELNTLANHDLLGASINVNANNKYFTSYAETLNHADYQPFTSKTATGIKEFNFPNLKTLINKNAAHAGNATFELQANSITEIKIPQLELINVGIGVFRNFNNLTLPSTLTSIIGWTNKGMINGVYNKLKLECVELDALPNYWYLGAAPAVLEVTEGWKADNSDFSLAGANMTDIEWWRDLIGNKLADVTSLTPNTRTIKIPAERYAELSSEDIADATAKGWSFLN